MWTRAGNFYPRPPRGGRPTRTRSSSWSITNFYPRPPRGGRQLPRGNSEHVNEFLSTPSARRATTYRTGTRTRRGYFYPRPPRGGRRAVYHTHLKPRNFYPRPPRGGRHKAAVVDIFQHRISIHALREEGDHPAPSGMPALPISIHALREEGDAVSAFSDAESTSKFLSTPSARRATEKAGPRYRAPVYFYPRPPRGGRQIFANNMVRNAKFLSTPSARRATCHG